MIAFAVNAVVLIWLMGSHRKLKHDVLVALLFGTIKAALVGILAFAVLDVGMLPAIVATALIRGLLSFLTCWAFLALLGRTDRIDREHRKAVAGGARVKKPAMFLEYTGMAIAGIACLFT